MLNGLAAKCDFGNQTVGLVYDIFILNTPNKQVQEKLCTEPKDKPLDVFRVAIAFEDGLKRQKTYDYISQEAKVKEEPVCTFSGNRQNNRECWRCGAGNFTLDHVKMCKTADAKCNYCGRKGHLERVCNQKRKDNTQQIAKSRANGVRDQFNKRVQLVDQDEDDEENENYMVLNLEGEEEKSKPYYMEGFINGNRFKTMIDSGSQVTIFALDELKSIMKRDKLQNREMIRGEKYVDFNEKKHLTFTRVRVLPIQVGDQFIKKARILVTGKGLKSKNRQRMAVHVTIQIRTSN